MNEHVDAVLAPAPEEGHRAGNPAAPAGEAKNPLLAALGDRVRNLRAQRGLTRKAVAVSAGVSERHLANLEYGIGNASILVLQQVAGALHCSLAELVGDVTTSSPEWLLIRELLENRSETDLRRAGPPAQCGGAAPDRPRPCPAARPAPRAHGAGRPRCGARAARGSAAIRVSWW